MNQRIPTMQLANITDNISHIRDRGIQYFLPDNSIARKSFAELHEDVCRLQDTLQSWGVGSGTRVGIMARNCYEFVLLDLALTRIGALSVCFPILEFEKVGMAELGTTYEVACVLLGPGIRTDEELPPWAARFGPDSWEQPRALRTEAPVVQMPKPDVFSLIFSSGTSGQLKCLPISRDSTEEWIDAYSRHYTFRPDDSMLVVLPLSNYQQRVMIYTALRYEFEVHLAQPETLFRALKQMRPTIIIGPPLFFEAVENRFRVLPARQKRLLMLAAQTIAKMPSAAARSWLQRRVFRPFHEAFGGRVRLMLSGGAPTRMSTLTLLELLGLPLFQAYGLTEAGVIAWNLPGANRPGSVGKPVFPEDIVLAEDGEILVKQRHPHSYGYLYCDEDVVKKTFTDENTIATGDIGTIDADGYLYITGRKKEIIITQGGYKVHPETLEKALEASELVARAVVFGGGALTGLVALVSLRGGDSDESKAAVQALVTELNETLPSPSRIGRVEFTTAQFTMESGFLTRNLKLDRKAIFEHFRSQLMQLAA